MIQVRFKTLAPWLVLGGFIVSETGCDDGRQEGFVPVSGKVLIDGEPLTTGVVKFAPHGGRQSMGAIESDGTFTLGSYKADDGALIGSHRIAVVAREQVNATTAKWFAPKKYSNYQSSGLTAEITEPTKGIELELTWGEQKGPFIVKE